jgi:hypothetical protein
VLGTNLLAGSWGAWFWWRREPSIWFWYLLRTAQLVTVLEVLLGLFLLIGLGKRAPDGLHPLYGVLPLFVTLISELMRAGAAQHELADVEDVHTLTPEEQSAVARRVVLREMAIMAVGALVIVTIAIRAVFTGT